MHGRCSRLAIVASGNNAASGASFNVGGRQQCSHQACGEARPFGPLSDTDMRITVNCVNGLNHKIELV
jgi:hypothetical protein